MLGSASNFPCLVLTHKLLPSEKDLRLRQLRDYSVPAFDASDLVLLKVLSGWSFLNVSKSAGDAGPPFRGSLRWPLYRVSVARSSSTSRPLAFIIESTSRRSERAPLYLCAPLNKQQSKAAGSLRQQHSSLKVAHAARSAITHLHLSAILPSRNSP